MAVHDVNVDQPSSGREHLTDLGAKPREVGRKDRRRNSPLVHQLKLRFTPRDLGLPRRHYSARNMLPRQWLHASTAVRDIRTIVECSPQFGHTDTSSYR